MTNETNKANEQGKRVKIEDLSKPEQELTSEETKEVKGGTRYAFASINRTEQPNSLTDDSSDTESNH